MFDYSSFSTTENIKGTISNPDLQYLDHKIDFCLQLKLSNNSNSLLPSLMRYSFHQN